MYIMMRLISLSLLVVWGLAYTPTASAADFSAWQRRMQITFAGYNPPGGATTLTNFPALVVLSTNIPFFSYGDFQSLTNQDLRFTADDGITELNYEVEKWDTNGSSYVWVQVPEMTDTNTAIWAYWDMSGQTAPAYTTNGAIWSSGYKGVWHMGQTNAQDSTGLTSPGISVSNETVSGFIGDGQRFSGSSAITNVGTVASYAFIQTSGVFTVSCFAKLAGTPANTAFVLMGNTVTTAEKGFFFLWDNRTIVSATRQLRFAIEKGTSGTPLIDADSSTDAVIDTSWHHVTAAGNGASIEFWVDGVSCGGTGGPMGAKAANNSTRALSFGIANTFWNTYDGMLDEIRIENVTRSSNWIWACYMNQASNGVFAGSFNSYGEVESPGVPWIANNGVSDITLATATVSGYLVSTGTADTTVFLYWGLTDGGTNAAAWPNTNRFTTPWPPEIGPLSTNIALSVPNTTYYYRYCATNATGVSWANSSANFIAGEVTVIATDDSASEVGLEPGTFIISRPDGATNEALTVYYNLGGSAGNGLDYDPIIANSVTLAAGATNATVTVTPMTDALVEGAETVILTLMPGAYAIGSAGSATVTIADVPATALYWDSNGSTPGAGSSPNGTWGVDSFWSSDPAGTLATDPWAAGTNAVFSAGGDSTGATVTVSGSRSASRITIEEGANTFLGVSSPALSMGTGGLTIQSSAGTTLFDASLPVSLAGDQTWTLNATNPVIVNSGFDGHNRKLTLQGAGQLILAGTNMSNINTLTPNDGTTIELSGSVRVTYLFPNNGATIVFGTNYSAVTQIRFNGSGSGIAIRAASSNAVTVTTGFDFYGGGIANKIYFGSADTGDLIMNGTHGSAQTGMQTMTVSNAMTTLNHNFTGTIGITKVGPGILVLGNTNIAYTGSTAVNAGTLLVNGGYSNTLNSVTVNAGASLGGTGTIGRVTTVAANGHLAPGALSVGTLSVTNLTMATSSVYDWEIGLNSSDSVCASNLVFGAGAKTLRVSDVGGPANGAGPYVLFSYSDAVTDDEAFVTAATNWVFEFGDWRWTTNRAPRISVDANANQILLSGLAGDAPAVQNAGASNITYNSATLCGYLSSTGDSAAAVLVCWGPTDGGTNQAAWAYTYRFAGSQAPGPLNTNVTFGTSNITYYYRFCSSNSTAFSWEAPTANFIAGEVNISAFDPAASEVGLDPGTFMVTRPVTTTNEALIVNYTVEGVASNGADYVQIGSSVTLAAGASTAIITITPLTDVLSEGDEDAILTLATGPYMMGPSASAAVTIADMISAYYWDSNGDAPGAGNTPNGTWGVDNFWSTYPPGTVATVPWTAGTNAVFSAGDDSASATITVSGSRSATGITIEEGANTFLGVSTPALSIGTGGLTIRSSAGPTLFGPSLPVSLSGDQTWTLNATNPVIVNGGFGGGGRRLNLQGTGRLVLAGTNVSSIGTLWAYNGTTLELSGSVGVTTLYGLDGATCIFGTNYSTVGTLLFSAVTKGVVIRAASSNDMFINANFSFNGGGVANKIYFGSADTGDLTINGTHVAAQTGMQTMTVSNAMTSLNHNFRGTMGITKGGPGILVLSNTNIAYTGSTTVNAGTLLINGGYSNTLNSVTVNSGATLGGTGTIGRVTTVATNGHLAPGALSIGTISVTNLTMATGAIYDWELGSNSADSVATSNLAFGAGIKTLRANDVGGAIQAGVPFVLFSYAEAVNDDAVFVSAATNWNCQFGTWRWNLERVLTIMVDTNANHVLIAVHEPSGAVYSVR